MLHPDMLKPERRDRAGTVGRVIIGLMIWAAMWIALDRAYQAMPKPTADDEECRK